MTKKEKLAPRLRFKKSDGTDYPAWEQRELGELAITFGYGLNAAAKVFDGSHKYLRITDIDETTRRFLSSSLTSPDIDFDEAKPYRLAEGDVLFARTGASVGKSYKYVKTDGEVYFAGFLIRFRFKDIETAEFVFQNTLTAQFQNFIKTSSQRSGQPGVNAQQYSGYQIAVPNFEEQKKIVKFFHQLDQIITLHQKKEEKLKILKKSLLQKMFPKNGETKPELRFPGFTDAWEQREFGNIAIRISSLSNKSDLPRVEYADIISGEGRLNKDIYAKERVKPGIEFKRGQVLYGKLRPYLQNWLLPTFSGIAVGDFWVLEPKNLDSQFLYYLIQAPHFSTISNVSVGTKMPRADWKLISQTSFRVPSCSEEQQKIGRFLSELDCVITLHQCKLKKLQLLKKALLQQMFV